MARRRRRGTSPPQSMRRAKFSKRRRRSGMSPVRMVRRTINSVLPRGLKL